MSWTGVGAAVDGGVPVVGSDHYWDGRVMHLASTTSEEYAKMLCEQILESS